MANQRVRIKYDDTYAGGGCALSMPDDHINYKSTDGNITVPISVADRDKLIVDLIERWAEHQPQGDGHYQNNWKLINLREELANADVNQHDHYISIQNRLIGALQKKRLLNLRADFIGSSNFDKVHRNYCKRILLLQSKLAQKPSWLGAEINNTLRGEIQSEIIELQRRMTENFIARFKIDNAKQKPTDEPKDDIRYLTFKAGIFTDVATACKAQTLEDAKRTARQRKHNGVIECADGKRGSIFKLRGGEWRLCGWKWQTEIEIIEEPTSTDPIRFLSSPDRHWFDGEMWVDCHAHTLKGAQRIAESTRAY